MSGAISGVQARLKHLNPSILYTHCFNHVLNLCLVDTVRSVRSASMFFELLQSLYTFVSGSAIHAKFIEVQSKLGHRRIMHLKKQCETRWACGASSIEAVFSRFSAVVQTLQWACAERNSSQAVEARGLLLQICDHSLILQQHIMRKIFNITLSLSNILQTKRLDLGKACMLVGATIEQLELIKDEEAFQKLNSEAKHFASQLLGDDDDYNQPVSKHIRRMPQHLQDSVVYEVISSSTLNNEISEKQRYKEVIDKILVELRQRFDVTNMSIMKAVQALLPCSENFFVASVIKRLVSHYSLDIGKLEVELPLAAKIVQDGIEKIVKEKELSEKRASIVDTDGNEELEDNDESTIIGLEDVLLSLKGFEAAFPQTMLVLRIAATL